MSNPFPAALQQIVPSGVLFQKPNSPQDKALPTDQIFHLSWAVSSGKVIANQDSSSCVFYAAREHLCLSLHQGQPQYCLQHRHGAILQEKCLDQSPLPGLYRGPRG